jgi:glycosyltransferase involved in cell wall biosynthesis
MTRLCFLIRRLNLGGAQRQLLALAASLARAHYEVTIITFYSGGLLSAQLDELPHVKNFSLNKRGRWDLFGFIIRLARALRALRPQILHSYLGVSNVLAVLLKPLLPQTRLVWGVRASDMDWSRYAWHERVVFNLQRKLARFVDLIIVNSHAGFSFLLAHGFPKHKLLVIQNGIDVQRFFPDAKARQRVRREWQVRDDEILIGLVARLDPMKDHSTFLRAAASFARKRESARFLCLGEGPQNYRRELQALAKELGLQARVIWSNGREDVPAVYNGLDLLTSSSAYGEGFSNVIGEAMACGVFCVVTDVGDSAQIVGASGVVILPHNPPQLAAAWQYLLDAPAEQRRSRGEQARQRIVENFSTTALAQKTSAALRNLL